MVGGRAEVWCADAELRKMRAMDHV